MMKNKSLWNRFRFAWAGICTGWVQEKSFRTQVVLAVGAIGVLIVLRPQAIWWAIFLLVIAGVLAVELINTALELVVDRLHPETHPMIRRAKDCAAGAVLILSIAAVGIFVALLLGR